MVAQMLISTGCQHDLLPQTRDSCYFKLGLKKLFIAFLMDTVTCLREMQTYIMKFPVGLLVLYLF